MTLTAGVGRSIITPYWGVELTGWGYYMERTWKRIHDDLYATALVVDDGRRQAAIVALDLMVIDTPFTERTRRIIHQATGIPPEAVLLACSHTHNAPSAGGLLGAGECDPFYEDWASRQAATAVITAWHNRCDARLSMAHEDLTGSTYNRTRDQGPVDTRLTTLRVDRTRGGTLALVVNFQAHPCVCTILRPYDVSRDVPGEVCDIIERALPGATALYLQGACGDVSFLPDYSTVQRCGEPAELVAELALKCHERARPVGEPLVAYSTMQVQVPTRRWRREEIFQPRQEAQHRLETDDIHRWREGIGRVMTNRPDDMIARHGGDEHKAVRAMARFVMAWSDLVLTDWKSRPEMLPTEVQALRLGDLYIAANSSELFSSLALELRGQCDLPELMIVGYANGRIGYMPDTHDIAQHSYAAYQSPKYCNQFPFTEASGPALRDAMRDAAFQLRETT